MEHLHQKDEESSQELPPKLPLVTKVIDFIRDITNLSLHGERATPQWILRKMKARKEGTYTQNK